MDARFVEGRLVMVPHHEPPSPGGPSFIGASHPKGVKSHENLPDRLSEWGCGNNSRRRRATATTHPCCPHTFLSTHNPFGHVIGCCGPKAKSIYSRPVNQPYFDIIRLIERLHRHFLDVLRTELRRLGIEDINAVQALLLYNIGENEVVIRDLKDRGYYQGSNVSYNIKALTESGYLTQERSPHDRRSVRLKLADKGMALCNAIRKLQDDLATALGDDAQTQGQLGTTLHTMQRLERTWTDFVQYGRIRSL